MIDLLQVTLPVALIFQWIIRQPWVLLSIIKTT